MDRSDKRGGVKGDSEKESNKKSTNVRKICEIQNA